jgi:excisionase family DNA binding protein
MSENWMTVEQAAVTLGLSVRTVTRHINAGKLQSRLTDGRREVQIDSVQIPGAVGATGAIANTETFADRDDAIDCETVLALADNAADKAELAVSAYQTLARSADERIHTTRRLSYAAWSIVAVMTVGTIVSVGWASHKMTRAAVETQHLQKQVTDATALADSAVGECDDLRRMLAAAREDAARAEGRLAAYNEPREAEPSTRPSLSDRLASLFE